MFPGGQQDWVAGRQEGMSVFLTSHFDVLRFSSVFCGPISQPPIPGSKSTQVKELPPLLGPLQILS